MKAGRVWGRPSATLLSRLLGVLVAALLMAGCSHFDWVVYVINDASVDVIVRVDHAGGTRDVFLPANAEDEVIVLPDPRPPATISLLDPVTCEVKASRELPAEPTVVGFSDDATLGTFHLVAYPKNVGSGPEAPADSRCQGR